MEKSDTLHVAMLPWLSFSHLKPFFELSKVIIQLGHHVYYLSTKPKIECLEAQTSSSSNLHFIPLVEEDVFESDPFKQPLVSFLQSASPKIDWIVYDTMQCWVPGVATQNGARSANVSVVSATANSFVWPLVQEETHPSMARLTNPHDWAPAGTDVAFRVHEGPYALGQIFDADESGLSLANRIKLSISNADVVAVRSSNELEGEWLQIFSDLCHKPVLALGHLPPSVSPVSPHVTNSSKIFTWLESQIPGSVLYVAFGSELTLTSNQVEELAYGIEYSGIPFLWAVRCLDGIPTGLLEGFEERTKDRGLLCKGWVPQVDILAHPVIGGFITHCGWNSVLEALQFGVPLVMLPLFGDEFLNARLISYKNLGVEISWKEDDGSIDRDEIAKTVKLVMVDTKGNEVRDKAEEMKSIVGTEEFHERYVKDFVGYLLENKVERE